MANLYCRFSLLAAKIVTTTCVTSVSGDSDTIPTCGTWPRTPPDATDSVALGGVQAALGYSIATSGLPSLRGMDSPGGH